MKAVDSVPVSLSSRLAAAAIAALLGSFILIGVGFANSDVIHNAAHDSRHSFAFPCH
ncbi:MAG: CbtB domain-containing protein [Pseudomonadota bacterium]|nr:CbtB domain-containing protein [Pseudomonadota bacterium]